MPEQNITKIGNYDVVGVIGEGGMGIVYKGIDPRIGRPVAIKMMTVGFSKNEDALARFYTEARFVGKLQHPNIVVVYDLGDQGGTPYLIMEYLDGESLDKVITARRDMSIVEKVHIIVRVLRALHYAHQRGIVHRDVKPGNVMVMPDGDCKLVDFGIARGGDSNLTHTGQIVGSMSYMSPEQLNGYDVDGRTDVWSAGVLLYQLLTYHLPFEGRDTSSLIVKILSENPPPLSTHLDYFYPPELDEIVRRALTRDRDARYATAEEFAFDLDHVEGLLKNQMVSESIREAQASLDSDLVRARELLSRVLKVDTQNSTAKQMLYQVQQLMQQQQRSEQVQTLRSQAEAALDKKNWEEALVLVEQALKMDQTNMELVGLRESVLRCKARKEQVLKLVSLADAARQAGELEMARRAVDDALALDPSDTQAQVLGTALVREIEQRRRFEELLRSVRQEVSASRFEEAARLLREAEALCPQATEIPPLKNLIAAGREEQLRTERLAGLRQDAEQLLAREQFAQAQAKAEEALRYDPANRAVLDLLEQIKIQQQNHWVAQQLASSEKLVAEGRITAALSLLENAESHSHDARLQLQIPIVRQKLEQKRASALAAVIASSNEALQRNDPDGAISILERALSELGRSKEIEKLLVAAKAAAAEAARRTQIEDTLQQAQGLWDTGAPDKAEALLSAALDSGLQDERIARLLASVRAHRQELKRNQEIEAAKEAAAKLREKQIEDARQMARLQIERGDLEDAVAYLESATGQLNDEGLKQLLTEACTRLDRRRRMDAAAAQARKLLDEGKPAEAIALLESQPQYSGESSTIRGVLERAKAKLQEQRAAEERLAKAKLEEQRAAEERQRKAALEEQRAAEERLAKAKLEEQRAAEERQRKAALEEQRAAEERQKKAALESPGNEIPVPEPPPQTQPDDFSATQLFSPPSSGPAPTVAPPERPVAADAVTVKAPKPSPIEASTAAVPVRPAARQPKAPPKMLFAVIAAVVLVLAAGLYLFLRPTGGGQVSVSFETDPAGVEVSADGKSCKAPCALNLKPGDYPLKASLDGYDPLEKQISVGKTPQTIALKLTAVAPVLGSVQVETNVDNADLFVDGALKGATSGKSTTLSLVPGSHEIRAEKSGFETAVQKVEIAKNSTATVQFTLNPAAGQTPQPPRDPYLMVTSVAGAKVAIDGSGVGKVPADGTFPAQVKPGKHRVDIELSGYKPWSGTVKANPGDTVPVRAALTELPKPAALIASFSADAGGIQQGQSTQLRWQALNAREVSIDHGIGSVSLQGSQQISPANSTTYTLTAKGDGEAVRRSVTVAVVALPPPVAPKQSPAQVPALPKPSIALFEAGSDTLEQGRSTKLSWATQNATEVSIDEGIGTVGPNGSREVKPGKSTNYTLTVKGPGGSESRSVQISVVSPPPQPMPQPPTIAAVPESNIILDTIQVRYKDAYESMVISELQVVWPSMSKQQKRAVEDTFKMFKAIKAHYDCSQPSISGDTAQCACKESVTYTTNDNKRQPPTVGSILFELKKSPDGKWYVQNRKGQ